MQSHTIHLPQRTLDDLFEEVGGYNCSHEVVHEVMGDHPLINPTPKEVIDGPS